MRYCPAQSRHDSGVGACLVESGLYLCILLYLLGLVVIFSPSLAFISLLFLFSFLLLFLLHLFFTLVRLASLGSRFSFSGTWRRVQHGQYSAVASLAALCLVSQLSVWSRGALLRRLGKRRCECSSNLCQA